MSAEYKFHCTHCTNTEFMLTVKPDPDFGEFSPGVRANGIDYPELVCTKCGWRKYLVGWDDGTLYFSDKHPYERYRKRGTE